ncbi:hypothetical protein LR48_Vigan05g041400 [Vigna angularis]|uniref:Uncharacterized protein n=1 Tax=Phaseolus angularis TaxID=3914 RepID=A0A0L9UIS6_PHAAN|nr:hypothetical protein LR48_Vigan05g041400 [Vigna angularis]
MLPVFTPRSMSKVVIEILMDLLVMDRMRSKYELRYDEASPQTTYFVTKGQICSIHEVKGIIGCIATILQRMIDYHDVSEGIVAWDQTREALLIAWKAYEGRALHNKGDNIV